MNPQSMIERMRQSESPVAFHRTGPLAIHPRLLDTNILLADIIRFMRTGEPTNLLTDARLGTIRVFVADHVPREVSKHLPRMAYDANVPVLEAIERWRVDYWPLMRVVQTSSLDSDDLRLALVEASDNDDAPTARVALALAPLVSLSDDPHLTKARLATADWRSIMVQGHAIAKVDTLHVGVSFATTVSADLGSAAFRAGVAKVRSSPKTTLIILVLIIGVIAIAWYVYSRKSDEERQAWSNRIQVTLASAQILGLAAVAGISCVVDEAKQAERSIEASKIAPAKSSTITADLCRLLASAPRPVTATQLAKAISSSQTAGRSTVQEVLRVLNHNPAFIRVGRYGWQLGASQVPDSRAMATLRKAFVQYVPYE